MSTPSLLNIPYRIKGGTSSGLLYSQIPETGAGDFTVTRATTPTAGLSTRINSQGFIELVPNNVARLDYPLGGAVNGCPALLVERSAVNLALHSRDLTQAAWVASGITPVRNAVGMDGAANTGTTLTATGANGTILQTLTHASEARVFSAYVRRTVGTGTIQITTNGGTTWTAITLTSAYTRFSTTATVTNGQVGFRIVTSGDAIVVDYCQGEAGDVATSAIPTTTQAITRGTETIGRTNVSSLIGQTEGTIYLEVDAPSASSQCFRINSGVSNAIHIFKNASDRYEAWIYPSTGQVILTDTSVRSGFVKIAFAYKSGQTALVINGGTPITSATAYSFSAALNEINFLQGVQVVRPARIRAFALYPTRLSNPELVTLTTP